MITADSHLHTSFSADSKTAPRDQILSAVSAGLSHMTFTDHYDPDFPEGDLDFTFDIDTYFHTLAELKEEFAGKIDIGIGIELGAQPHIPGMLNELASGYPFDFVINSTHLVKRIDPYDTRIYFRDRTEKEGLRLYFEEVLANLNVFEDYDSAGHIDYAFRYLPSHSRDYAPYPEYGDVLDEILKTVIDKGKCLEINTAGLKTGLTFAHPHPEILKRYRELGGELITTGSDAHNPAQIGKYFDVTGDLLTNLGFRYYAVFRNRKPVFLPL